MKFDVCKKENHDDLKTVICIIKTMQHLLDRLTQLLEKRIEVCNGQTTETGTPQTEKKD